MRKVLARATIGLAVALVLSGCGGGDSSSSQTPSGTGASNSPAADASASGSLNIKGSDTMVNLTQAWAETYMKAHPSAQIAVTGGGSGTGIAALQNHTTDVAMSSRDIKDSEKTQIEKSGATLKELTVARDAVVVGVNPANAVKSLTIDQLADIYTGKVTDWGQVGGKPGKIVAVSRDRSSGTHVFFLEHVLQRGGKDKEAQYATSVLLLPSSKAIVDEVAKNPNAIGYFGLGYEDPAKTRALEVAAKTGDKAIAPSLDTVVSGTYPISRPLHFYAAGDPAGLAKDFLDFTLSADGQKLVEEQGFVPLGEAAKSSGGTQ
jgi:phosphate transport system substrate-binding protein